jgi:hypothetical protein
MVFNAPIQWRNPCPHGHSPVTTLLRFTVLGRLPPRPLLPQSATHGNFATAGICPPGLASYRDSIRLAAGHTCTASDDAAIRTCGPCSFMGHGLFCAMHRRKLILRASGFKS